MSDTGQVEIEAEAPAALDELLLDTENNTWEIEKAALQQANFNLTQELGDVKERLQDVSVRSFKQQEELARNAAEIIESGKQRRALETARNELNQKNIELESSAARLRVEKEERDNAIVSLNREKQTVLVEIFALKDELKSMSDEKAALKLSMETVQQEKRTLMFEREKSASEKDMYTESKKWFMKEISERDQKIANLRTELNMKDMESLNGKLQLENELRTVRLQIEELSEKLQLAQNNNEKLRKRIEESEELHKNEVSNIEAELRCQAELAKLHKDSLDEAEKVSTELRDELIAREGTLQEVQKVLEEVQLEVSQERSALEAKMADKDSEVEQLKIELRNTNELLKSKHAVHVNVTEAELAALSPAAAETARLLRGGQSLTGLIKEHGRLAGELAEARETIKHLEQSIHELCQDIQDRAPELMSQKNMLDASFDQNTSLKQQLTDAEGERQKLINQRDSATRELAFTRTELEKYQRDYERVTKQVHQLMFAAERQHRASDSDWADSDDEKLYTTIVQLQQRNMQLECDIEREKACAAQTAMATQNTELTKLKQELAASKEAERKLMTQAQQLKTALDVTKTQASHFQELVKDSVTATEARNARIKAEEAHAQAVAAEMKANRLDEYVKVLKEERDKREVMLSQRLEASEGSLNSLRTSKATLEVALETQKKLAEELVKEVECRQKEVESNQKEVEKLLANDVRRAQQIEDLKTRLIALQDEASSLRVEKRYMSDELASAKSDAARLNAEVGSLRSVVTHEQQVMYSLNELTARLSRIEAEKQSHSSTQHDALRLERDSLKSTAARLGDQLTHTRNEAKLLQSRLEQELNAARTQLIEKETQLAFGEKELVELRSKLASVQAQYTQSDTDTMTPDRLKKECQQLKNRTQFLENQLDELKQKLTEAELEKAKRDDEKALVETHSGVLEENLKKAEQLGSMERERLEAKVQAHSTRAEELNQQLVSLRQEHEQAKTALGDLQVENERENFELRRRLDVAELQLNDLRVKNEEALAKVVEAQADVDRKTAEVAEVNTILANSRGSLAETEQQCLVLKSQLDAKIVALAAAQDAARQADYLREASDVALAAKVAEKEAFETESRQTLNEYQTKLDSIVQQYEALVLMNATSAADVSSASLDETAIAASTDQQALSSMQNVLQFIREEKDKALARSMNAEFAMKRLKAETSEMEAIKNELIVKNRNLEAENIANSAALIERAKLLETVESLSSVQRENSHLATEKARLTNTLAAIQKHKSDADLKNINLASQVTDLNMRLMTVTNEVTARRKENEHLKQRLETAGRGYAATIQTELDQVRSKLAMAQEEAKKAHEQAKAAEKAKLTAEEAQKKATENSVKLRQLALKYREDSEKLKKLNESTASGTTAPTPAPENTAQLDELKKQVDDLTKANAELSLGNMRLNALEKTLKKEQDTKAEWAVEKENLKQKLNDVEREKSELVLRLSSIPAPTPTVSREATTPVRTPVRAQPSSLTASPVPRSSFTQPGSAIAAAAKLATTPQKAPSVALPQVAPSIPPIVPAQPLPPVVSSLSSSSASEEMIFRESATPPAVPLDVVPPVPEVAVAEPSAPAPVPVQQQQQLQQPAVPSSTLPTFNLSARVPAANLFGAPSPADTSKQPSTSQLPNIGETGQGVTYSLATSSAPSLLHGQSLFGKSAPAPQPSISTSSNLSIEEALLLPEESVVEAAQSSVVTAGGDRSGPNGDIDLSVNDGSSRDSSTAAAGVSSSDGKRKRANSDDDAQDAKRQRGSPSEAVTSSENRPNPSHAEIPELDEDVLVMEQDVSDEDANDLGERLQRVHDIVDLEDDDDNEPVEELDDDGEEMMDEEVNDDSSFGEEDVAEPDDDEVDVIDEVHQEQGEDDDIIELDDSENEEDADSNSIDDDDEEERGNDDEVIGGEDSQPSLDDQDREAASAIEEADDEGRASVERAIEDNVVAGVDAAQPPDFPRLRIPQVYDRDGDREDQCSSSNETTEGSQPGPSGISARGTGAARMTRRQQNVRGRGRARAIYQPPAGRSARGRGAPQ